MPSGLPWWCDTAAASPNTGLVWGPEGAEVIRGDSFVFTCSISSHFPGGVFSLIFSGCNITETKPAVNNSASFSFPEADYEHRGNYSCVYEVTLSSRKFMSTSTAIMSITLKLPVLLLVSSVSAPLFMLLLVFLVTFLVCRRRKRARQPEALVQIQMAPRINDEEEEHYVNLEQQYTKKRADQAQSVEKEVCDEDHEWDEKDSHNESKESDDKEGNKDDNVYELDKDNIYVTLEGSKEEEECHAGDAGMREVSVEQKTKDCDDTYMNIAQALPDDSVDIYGEQEAIKTFNLLFQRIPVATIEKVKLTYPFEVTKDLSFESEVFNVSL
ncbi:unnamed protein product [Oreochromis niloticus]|nr:unnamed protein product [Mustela putorius furo]